MPRRTNDGETCPDRPTAMTDGTHVWELVDPPGTVLLHVCAYCGAARWSTWIPLENERKESESESGTDE